MIRLVRSLTVGASVLCSTATAATAATIVQNATNSGPWTEPGSFLGFDHSLGRLDSVTLQISGTERRIVGASYPQGATGPILIDWSIDGYANFRFSSVGTVNSLIANLAVPISGSGQVSVTEGTSWYMTPSGSGTFAIDPTLIPDISNYVSPWPPGFPPAGGLRLSYLGPGFYDYSDTQFTSSEPIQININGGCGLPLGQMDCNTYQYVLTYEYTPADLVGVPEPATWAMMILGFGLIGGAMRRKQRQVVRFNFA